MIAYWSLIKRKLGSAILRVGDYSSTLSCTSSTWLNQNIKLGLKCQFGRNALLRATDGGSIELGARTSVGRNAQIVAQSGHIVIKDDVHIGDGVIIVCRDSIYIGSDTQIAEYVVIRDQDHETHTRPIRLAGFRTAPIHIGQDVWIGSKASILRGVRIGDAAVIGAHALVRNDVPTGVLAVGVPAKVVQRMSGIE